MDGNVEKITSDGFNRRDSDAKDKTDIVDPVSVPSENSSIVIKGGSWNVGANQCTAKQRDRVGAPGRGFRVVLAKSWSN